MEFIAYGVWPLWHLCSTTQGQFLGGGVRGLCWSNLSLFTPALKAVSGVSVLLFINICIVVVQGKGVHGLLDLLFSWLGRCFGLQKCPWHFPWAGWWDPRCFFADSRSAVWATGQPGKTAGRWGGTEEEKETGQLSQKGQNVCCAKNTQPHCWYYISRQWHWAISRWWMGGAAILLGEIRWPKACRGSVEHSGRGEHLQGGVSLGSVLGLWHPGEDSHVCLGWDFSSGSHPRFLRGSADVVSPGKHEESSRTCGARRCASSRICGMLLLGRHLPRACKFKTEACSVQGLSV